MSTTLLDYLRISEENPKRLISKWRLLLWSGGILTALLQTWAYRHNLRSDGIAYLDIASQCAHGDWHSLANAYWSPLYPFLLSVALRLFKPSPVWESTVAHFVNFGIFAVSFACFEVFLKELIRSLRSRANPSADREAMPDWALWAVGDSLFVWSTLLFIQMERIQPDLCVAALVYLAAAALLRIWAGKNGWIVYAGLGATLGVAYLAKAVMFPLAFVFIGCALFAGRPFRQSLPRTALALAVFLLAASPFVSALSQQKGRLTYGDVGKIAYAEFVDGVPRFTHWQGGPPGTGTPVHPTRMLRVTPPVFEFATPILGTYPPWYDSSYWYEGIVPKFAWKNQLRAIRYSIEEYVGILPYMAGLFVGFAGMALFAHARGPVPESVISYWPLWVPGVAAIGVYGLVYVESRFVAPFFALIWVALFAGLRFPRSAAAKTLVASLTLATVLVLATGIAWLGGRALFRSMQPQPFADWEVAQGLQSFGVHSGDRVGSIGYALDAYWAHLAGVRIAAEIPLWGTPSFWAAGAKSQSEVFADFARTGAKIIVTDQRPPIESRDGWREIGATGYFVHAIGSATNAEGLK